MTKKTTKMKKKQEKNILFLDFDGCLNSFEEGSYRTNTNETYGTSKTICERLKSLCDRTNSKIIISSNWRKFDPDGCYTFDGNKVQNPLGKVRDMYGKYIIGTLPPVRHVNKSQALILWLEENGEPDHWVVIDDDPREQLGITTDHGIKNHYIQTDSEFGITDEIIERVENILTMPF